MNISPELLRALLIDLGILSATTISGFFIERLLINRFRKITNADNSGQWRMWRGLGWLSGIWLGLGIGMENHSITGAWHEHVLLIWKIMGVLIGTVYMSRVLGRVVQHNTRHVVSSLPSVSLLRYVVKVTVYILGALIILQLVDISITPILTALGVGGLAVALALQDTLSNLFAGIQIIASRKLQPGQFIALEGGQEGYITDIAWRTTILRTLADTMIIVPNKTISNSIVTNTWMPDSSILVEVAGEVSYASDLEKVERVILEIAEGLQKNHKGASKKDHPTVRFFNFGASGIGFNVKLRVLEYDWQNEIKHEMIKALHRRFQEEGIEIPFPVRTIRFDKPSRKGGISGTDEQGNS